MASPAATPDPRDPHATPRSALPIFLTCWLALLADGYDLYVYGATLPGFIGPQNWGVTREQAGLVGSLALVGMLIGSLAAGVLTDRFGRRRMFAVSVATFSAFMVACALAPTFTVFGVFRFLACLGVGGLLPTAVAVANEFAGAARKSIVLGAVLTGPAVGTVIASTAAATLIPDHGVRPVYAIGGLALLLIPVALRVLPESPAFLRVRGRDDEADAIAGRYGLPVPERARRVGSATPTAAGGLFQGGLAPATLGIWAICLLSLLTIFGLTTWLPQVMREAGFGTSAAIRFLLWYSLGAIVGTLIASRVGQRTSPKVVVVIGFASAALALAFVSTQPTGVALIAAVVVAGFGGLGTQNMINDHIAQFYPAHLRATGLGWALAVGRIGAIAGPTYGAMMIGATGGVQAAAIAFGVPAAIGAVIALALPSTARRHGSAEPGETMLEPTRAES